MNVHFLPTLLVASEYWAIKAKPKSSIVTAEMKHIGKRSVYNYLDCKTRSGILNE